MSKREELVEAVKDAQDVQEWLELPGTKKFFFLVEEKIKFFYSLVNKTPVWSFLDEFDPDKDARIKQIAIAEQRGLNAIRTLPDVIIRKGQKAMDKLNKLSEEGKRDE